MSSSSPNTSIYPVSTQINEKGHLVVGGCDLVQLADDYGTPLWVLDEASIVAAASSYTNGLSDYPDRLVLYAGKAFLCLAMCHLLKKLGLGLDVVSEGELYTAIQAGFPGDRIYMHGNNKSPSELRRGIELGDVKIVVDNLSELRMVAAIAKECRRKTNVLFRVIPCVEPDTHQHIKTGHEESKFGIPQEELIAVVQTALSFKEEINVLGIHAHIGSQAQQMEPYLENIDTLVSIAARLKSELGLEIKELDIGGGLGITYQEQDQPVAIAEWSRRSAQRVISACQTHGLKLPRLLVEPGRSIVGTAGVTVYRAGARKTLPNGKRYLPVDGGMADNPRPITYQAKYTAAVANRMNGHSSAAPLTIVGKYCESGDIIIEEALLDADTGDLIAVFGTGAYNFSMASNYNRSPKPACVLVTNGQAETIVERETQQDLIRQDRVPQRLLE